jgi:hypothetical protein
MHGDIIFRLILSGLNWGMNEQTLPTTTVLVNIYTLELHLGGGGELVLQLVAQILVDISAMGFGCLNVTLSPRFKY